jgi:two-component system invasion response regulator UvrY
MIKIVLADDHALVRICEVDSGEAACSAILEKKIDFDVLVIDLTMGGISGIEATRRIISHKPDIKILGLSAHEDPSYIRHMMHAGASAYLSKRSAPDSLITAIRAINAGQLFIDPYLKDLIAERQQNPDPNPIDVLSEKEFEVFIHLARGASANDVAEILHVSPRTTGTHLYNIKQKLNASTQSDLTLIALRHDLIKP